MLRLSSDSLSISFSPEGFKLEKRHGFWRSRLIDAVLVRIRSGMNGHAWKACLQSLQTTLGEERWQGLPMQITLSDRVVRYLLVPALPTLATPQERLAYAQFQFRETYGSVVDEWDIRVDNAFPNSPAIACGLDKDLSEGLLALGQFSKGKVESLTPRFVATINRTLSKLRNIEDHRFVLNLYENGGLTSVLIRGGQWRSIRQRFINTSAIASLCNILEQERLDSPIQHETTKVFLLNWPALSEDDIAKVDRCWQLHHFALSDPLSDLDGGE